MTHKYPSSIIFPDTQLLVQTLTTLALQDNQIGDQEAQHLANALQQNKVTTTLLLLLNTSPSSYADTHHTIPPI